ncbi:MAG: DUF2510 domain-containing protein [Acidimicrobiales bacterium]
MANTPPGSAIQVKTRYRPLAFILGLCHPRLTLDGGTSAVGNWGETHIPVMPGRHTVRCSFRYLYLSEAGDSSVTVDVAPGQVVAVTYVAPWLVFLAGKWSVGEGASAVGTGASTTSGVGAAGPYAGTASPYSSNPGVPPTYSSNPGAASPYSSNPATASAYGSTPGLGAPSPGIGATPGVAPYGATPGVGVPDASNQSPPAQAPSGLVGGSSGSRETVVFAPGPYQEPRPLAPTEPPTVTSAAPAGWLPDPRGHHQLRYWDGGAWTEHVSDSGVTGVDPL